MYPENLNENLGNTTTLLTQPLFKNILNESRKWARFLGILGYIGCVLMVVFAVAMMLVGTALPLPGLENFGLSASMGLVGVFYLLMAVLYYFPSHYLYTFSKRIKTALQEENEQALIEGMDQLKSFFKFWGILIAIMLGLYALGLIMGILFSLAVGV